ncbi:oxidoreductase [Streptomyces sp. NPDC059477]|uniref:oxidoreductase n=1 Tax=Streptomyces sp. NPDC059477 TaxID=3346847 RepID=UPI0036A66D55
MDADSMREGRRLTARVADALSAAGVARHFVPARWGGREAGFTELTETVMDMAHACASTAWCAALYAAHSRLAAFMPEQGQRQIWGEGPDVRIAAAVMPPRGRAVRVPGGWELTGTWSYASGVDHAHWVLLAAPIGPEREPHVLAVPRSQLTVHHTWDTLGMRGTGSNSVEADALFVADELTCTMADLHRAPATAAACYRVPVALVAGLQFAAPIVGAAQAAEMTFLRFWSHRGSPDGAAVALPSAVQQTVSEASAAVSAASLLLREAARRADACVTSPLHIARNQQHLAYAAHSCARAVDQLFRASGSRAMANDDPLQAIWRDVTAAASHVTLDPAAAAAAYAAAVLGPEGAR